MRDSAGFQYIDRDRLLLAVQVAKRDVKFLSSRKPEDEEYIHETIQNFNNSYPLVPSDNQLIKKPTQVVRNNDQRSKSVLCKSRISSKNILRQTAHDPGTGEQYQTFEEKAPPYSDSPPIRDTNIWTPNRKRALHEPTDKQLRNSQESRIRQLQAKLSQYSAALEQLQEECLSDKVQPQELKSISKTRKKSLLKLPVNRSKSIISSIVRPKSAALRPNLVHRLDSRNPSKIKSHSFTTNYLTTTNFNSRNPKNHYDSKVSLLWEQAMKPLFKTDGLGISTCNHDEYLKDEDQTKSFSATTDIHYPQNSSNQLTINTVKSDLDDCRVLCSAAKELLQQIDEAELEENVIRRRWANKLTYINNSNLPLENESCNIISNAACQHHKLDAFLFPSDKFESQQNDKSLLRPVTSSSQFPKNEVDSNVKSHNPVNKKATPLAHFHPLILPVRFHRQLLQSKAKRDVNAKNIWFYLGPTTTFDNLPDIPVTQVCEDLTNDLIQEAIDEFYQTVDRTASELVDELIKAELLSEAPDVTLSFDKCDGDDPHGLSTPVSFHQSDLKVHEFDTPIVCKDVDSDPSSSNVTAIFQNASNISSSERSVNELSNYENTSCNHGEDISDKYTSEFEEDTIS
ncbi:hypothetical protein MN116_005872 [Schistosoma mekongi]|uniref:Uncharacterized protein n=1 Tax=Schistosoma mekongi TaxID=38744 RepID=A0AAE2D4X8_SCHME|nr:hypothetical protein MN116_005872 [Schistosoma mekongi]